MPGFCSVLLATVDESQLGYFGLGGSRRLPKVTPVMSKIQASPKALVWFVRSGEQGRGATLHPRREVRDEDRIGHAQRPVVPGRPGGQGPDEDDIGGNRYEVRVAVADPPFAEADRVARAVPDVADPDGPANLADVRERPVGRPRRLPAGELEARTDAGEIAVARRLIVRQRLRRAGQIPVRRRCRTGTGTR